MALEDEVSSRVVMEDCGSYPWEVVFGPFEEGELDRLPNAGWTILVGQVDHHVPAVADLVRPYRFLPNWRIDDVQVSYAPPQGTAGPHVDNYDVFLLQGYGTRRWQISHTPAPADAPMVPDADVAILEDFQADAEWELHPGDLLYLPPRIPHWGVAVDACMTISIGFRAPTEQELLQEFFGDAIESLEQDTRFGDARRAPLRHPGLITEDDLAWVRQAVRRLATTDEVIDRWFGQHVTRAEESEELEPADASTLLDGLRAGAALRRRSVAHWAHMEVPGGVRLFAGGQEWHCLGAMADAARLLTGAEPLTLDTLNPYLGIPEFVDMLGALARSGCLTLNAP